MTVIPFLFSLFLGSATKEVIFHVAGNLLFSKHQTMFQNCNLARLQLSPNLYQEHHPHRFLRHHLLIDPGKFFIGNGGGMLPKSTLPSLFPVPAETGNPNIHPQSLDSEFCSIAERFDAATREQAYTVVHIDPG